MRIALVNGRCSEANKLAYLTGTFSFSNLLSSSNSSLVRVALFLQVSSARDTIVSQFLRAVANLVANSTMLHVPKHVSEHPYS